MNPRAISWLCCSSSRASSSASESRDDRFGEVVPPFAAPAGETAPLETAPLGAKESLRAGWGGPARWAP